MITQVSVRLAVSELKRRTRYRGREPYSWKDEAGYRSVKAPASCPQFPHKLWSHRSGQPATHTHIDIAQQSNRAELNYTFIHHLQISSHSSNSEIHISELHSNQFQNWAAWDSYAWMNYQKITHISVCFPNSHSTSWEHLFSQHPPIHFPSPLILQ